MSLKTLGRYEIIKPLGQGAMGVVYEAHDPHINRAVAVKTIRVDQLSTDMAAEFEARFRCETQAGGRLQHPNIIGVYDAGCDQGLAFMVMELVRGGDLRQQLIAGQPQPFVRAMSVMKELLSALSFAHEQGIIHRDVKPANVMLDMRGRVKLGDFGIAQIADVDVDAPQATRMQGSTLGTLKYLSPEQVSGEPVDARADLFAAGVVMYQMLTGTKPFEGDSDFAVMQAIVQRDPTRPTVLNLGLPVGIDAVLFKALAKDRDDRYASARDFALALRGVTQQAAAGGQAKLAQPGSRQRVSAVVNAAHDEDATRLARPVDQVAAAAQAARAVAAAAAEVAHAAALAAPPVAAPTLVTPTERGKGRVIAPHHHHRLARRRRVVRHPRHRDAGVAPTGCRAGIADANANSCGARASASAGARTSRAERSADSKHCDKGSARCTGTP